ncbi:MAG TPA: right-handed parallel beta-helix repeat-containing protein [Candidatus Binatia bacterium]|nr:right-handed parallel beta-helix repeat-containing protein [Candidatus Binatia bacterium]
MRTLALCCAVLAASGARAATVTVPGTYPTIRAAVRSAPAGTVIQIQPGHYHEHLRIQRGKRALTLRGVPEDPAQVVIDGDGRPPSVIQLYNSRNVVIEGITITGGREPSLRRWGGGIRMRYAQVTFRDCVIAGNQAFRGGGAVLFGSTATLERCVVQGNSAASLGGGILIDEASSRDGHPSTLTLTGCQVVGNEAGTRDANNGWGGGIYVHNSVATLSATRVAQNRGRFAGGGMAVVAYVRNATLTMTDCTLENNAVLQANPRDIAEGGGLHIEENVSASLTRVTVRGNTANLGGGLSDYQAAYTITDSVIEDNTSVAVDAANGGYGGGLSATSVNVSRPVHGPASVTLTRTLVDGNRGRYGGGLFIQGDFAGLSDNRGALTMTDSLVVDNAAEVMGGGLLAHLADVAIEDTQLLMNGATASGASGGAIEAVASALALTRTTIAGNAAAGNGAGVYVDLGGSLRVDGSAFVGNTVSAAQPVAGAAIMVTDQLARGAGPTAGSVQNTSFVGDAANPDVKDFEIVEYGCNQPGFSTIQYTGNAFATSAGTGVYTRYCGPTAADAAAFNQLAGKAAGNIDGAPPFFAFVAAPATIAPGGTSMLGWVAPGAKAIAIAQVGTLPGPIGVTAVSPTATVTYAASSSGGGAAATVTVGGTPPPAP